MLTAQPISPAQALNLSFRRLKPTQAELDFFEGARRRLLAEVDALEAGRQEERFLEKSVADFLKAALGADYHVMPNGKQDLAARFGPGADDALGLIIEVKKPDNKAEKLRPDALNRKAFYQLVLYYMRAKAAGQADRLAHLLSTDGREWFGFDAADFYALFWKNKLFRKQYEDWARGALPGTGNDYFYQEVARPYVEGLADTALRFAYCDLRTEPAGGSGVTSIVGQLHRLKLFSATHLLKLPLPGADGNTLNRGFYTELLYLMGLEEVSERGRKLIRRCAPERRQPGSLLENTLEQLAAENLLPRLSAERREAYGLSADADADTQATEAALALGLTWVSRLLFLKLLEGQLRRYHGPTEGERFRFLRPDDIREYDHLNRLFYRVLNRPLAQRGPREVRDFALLPYLNSTLFEPGALEQDTLRISGLDDGLPLPLLGGGGGAGGSGGAGKGKSGGARSVLFQHDPALRAGDALPALTYLLRFLDAYDFSAEASEEVQPAAKTLISAPVLGLIFEKINGYRDGSFYTPGFVTMYMCRHTLGRAVLSHFNRHYGWTAASTPELAECIRERPRAERPALARHLATLRVCDPAVGSGHFLVSALNELLVLRAELGLLLDADGQRLPYALSIDRDELVVRDEDDNLVAYRATLDPLTGRRSVGAAFTRLQQTLFNTKRELLEHCLYGVDLNPNSVRICRLRLWIELLKHAYYSPASDFRELEVLPNLDLNVQAGNSLLARFGLADDLGDVFRQARFSLATYRDVTHSYFQARGPEAKAELQAFLGQMKAEFRTTIFRQDPRRKRLADIQNELLRIRTGGEADLFGQVRLSEEEVWAQTAVQQQNLARAERKLAEHEQGTLYRRAFEWRFEFPGVLADDGSFRGFDVVLGNPPYIRQEELDPALKPYLKQHYRTGTGTADLYVYFYELGLRLLAEGGELSYITNNKWLRAGYGAGLRAHLLQPHLELVELIDFGDLPVFPEATTYPNILSVRRAPAGPSLRVAQLDHLDTTHFAESVAAAATELPTARLSAEAWSFNNTSHQTLLDKISAVGTPLGKYLGAKIYNGVKTGYNEAFVLDEASRDTLIAADPACAKFIKPFLTGRDVKRYKLPATDTFLLYITWADVFEKLPTPLQTHLYTYETGLRNRSEVRAGNYPWYALERPRTEIQELFNKPKIVFPDIAPILSFTLDTGGHCLVNTVYFLSSDDLFLLGVLNSSVIDALFRSISANIRGGYLRFFKPYLEQLPIPPAKAAQQAPLVAVVGQILAAKASGAPTAALEAEADALVAALYGLSAAEAAALGR